MKDKAFLNFYYLFWIFIVGCVVGWLVEGAFSLIRYQELVNHSALVVGPFNVAYGLSACCLSMLLHKYKDDGLLKIFAIGFVGGSIVEYIMSWGMELVLGFTAWDYSDNFLNINGRICLLFSIFWGFLGILWIKILYPQFDKILNKINPKIYKILIVCLSIFLLLDILLTISAVSRARNADKGIPPNNGYERFLDSTFNSKYLKNMFNDNWQ